MKTRWILLFPILLIGVPQLVAADKGDHPDGLMLVEPGQLQKMLLDERLCVLDVRTEEEYAKAHIPGAVRVDVADWKNLAVSDEGLHDSKGWSKKVGSLGIAEESHVVLYGDKVSNTARIWWLLKYVGVKNASLLNGGWLGWTKDNRPVDQSATSRKATKFTPDFQADRVVEIDSLKRSVRTRNFRVVDTRSDDEFAGGRIPDSVHLEWKHLLDEDGRFKTSEELKELFQRKGIVPAETAVCY